MGIIIIGFMILGNTKGDETAQRVLQNSGTGEEVQAGEKLRYRGERSDEVEKTDIVEPEETPQKLIAGRNAVPQKRQKHRQGQGGSRGKAKADAQAAAQGNM